MHVRNLIRAASLFLLIENSGLSTIGLAVGTRQGLLVCGDQRLSDDDGNTYEDGFHKVQPIHDFGLYSVAGDITSVNLLSPGSHIVLSTNYDARSTIASFFNTSEIRDFNDDQAMLLEAKLRDDISRGIAASKPRSVDIFLAWLDRSAKTNIYYRRITAGQPAQSFKPRFLPLRAFSKPQAWGDGKDGYDAISSSSDACFADARQNKTIASLLAIGDGWSELDAAVAARGSKLIIEMISQKQLCVKAKGLGVGPDSDCYLLGQTGTKDMNAMSSKDKNPADATPKADNRRVR